MVVLTPGPFNSAYFEHTFLARTMGIELVEPSDLFVEDDQVFVRTTHGPERVHVIYRRIDDAYLDPEFFRPDSLLGVPGLMRAYAAGQVTLANAPGNGCADDKAVYPFVPDMIRYYLGEEPILPQVDTYVCARRRRPGLRAREPAPAGGQGGRRGGRLRHVDGPAGQRRRARRVPACASAAEPRRYIAQHRVELSTCPTWDPARAELAPRRVDLRPFVLTRPSGSWVLPGGLTRVALVEGSYVVNSQPGRRLQGHLGAEGDRRGPRDLRAWPTTASGSGATSTGPRAPPGCCRPRARWCSTPTSRSPSAGSRWSSSRANTRRSSNARRRRSRATARWSSTT